MKGGEGVLCCDRFCLDLTRGFLRVGAEDVALRPKAFEVLHYLAKNAGRLVAKEELYDAVWPDVTVSDDSIAQCIRELRNKLGDGDHSLIRTVPRRGYLLDAMVSTAVAEGPEPDPVPVPSPPAHTPAEPRHALRSRDEDGAALPPQPPPSRSDPPPPKRTIAWRMRAWVAVGVVLLSGAWWANHVLGWDPGRLATRSKLETSRPEGEFDGIWRVEFTNNDFCIERSRVRLWAIRQSGLSGGVAGKMTGTVSDTGELKVAWPALIDPTRTNTGSGQLRGDHGEGKWDGERKCAGAFRLERVAP